MERRVLTILSMLNVALSGGLWVRKIDSHIPGVLAFGCAGTMHPPSNHVDQQEQFKTSLPILGSRSEVSRKNDLSILEDVRTFAACSRHDGRLRARPWETPKQIMVPTHALDRVSA